MTTTVEPEETRSRWGLRRLFLLGAASVAAVSLIVAGTCALTGDDSPVTEQDNPAAGETGPFIAEASFVLQNYDTLTTEERAFWSGLTFDQIVSQGLPFLHTNRYYTRFFLKEMEVVELSMESSVPIGTDLAGMKEGISVMLIPGSAPYGQSHAHDYLPPTESGNGGYFDGLRRSGNSWHVRWAIAALESDYYWLVLTNTARQDARCHVSISVPSE
ncbi:MAG: hypothetical protein ACOC7M_01280 [Chloroflexota bacterium]